MTTRRGYTPSLRDAFRRMCKAYDYRCVYCGSRAKLVRDHVVPIGIGEDVLSNTVPCCGSCNVLKGSRSVEEFREFRRRLSGWWLYDPEQHNRLAERIAEEVKATTMPTWRDASRDPNDWFHMSQRDCDTRATPVTAEKTG